MEHVRELPLILTRHTLQAFHRPLALRFVETAQSLGHPLRRHLSCGRTTRQGTAAAGTRFSDGVYAGVCRGSFGKLSSVAP